jgi:hypothetical protein
MSTFKINNAFSKNISGKVNSIYILYIIILEFFIKLRDKIIMIVDNINT